MTFPLSGPGTPNDTTTTLSKGSQDGDTFDESVVANSAGTLVKRERVVPGDDVGNVIEQFPMRSDARHAMPVQVDPDERRILETMMLAQLNDATILNGFDSRDGFSLGMRGGAFGSPGTR